MNLELTPDLVTLLTGMQATINDMQAELSARSTPSFGPSPPSPPRSAHRTAWTRWWDCSARGPVRCARDPTRFVSTTDKILDERKGWGRGAQPADRPPRDRRGHREVLGDRGSQCGRRYDEGPPALEQAPGFLRGVGRSGEPHARRDRVDAEVLAPQGPDPPVHEGKADRRPAVSYVDLCDDHHHAGGEAAS